MTVQPEPAPGRPEAKPPSVLLLVALTAIGSFSLNVFVPSMPGLMKTFGVSYGIAQLTLTLYLVGVALGQLLYGPLSDRFGRRPVLLGGLAVFVGASALCLLAVSIEMLVLGRIAQAVGGCAGMVLSRAIVRDVYGRDKAASVLAYVTMAMAVAPAVAPALGGLLDEWFGWRASFVLLTATGAMVLAWSLAALRETNRERQPVPGLAGMARSFAGLLRSPEFLGYAFNTSFSSATFFGFLAGAPYIMSEILGRPPSSYGLLFGIISIGYMLGSFAAGRLSVRFGARRMVLCGSAVGLAGVLAMGGWIAAAGTTPLALFLPMTLVALGNGMSMPNAIAAAISVDPRAAGAASGLVGFLQMGTAALSTVAVGSLKGDGAMPMVWVLLACSLGALAAYRLAVRARPSAVPMAVAGD